MSYLTDKEKGILFTALRNEKLICEEMDKWAALSGVRREEATCEEMDKTDADGKGRVELMPIVESLERKFFHDRFEREIRDKAVEEFTEQICKASESVRPVGWTTRQEVVLLKRVQEIAEQIKENSKCHLIYDEESEHNAKDVKFIADTYGYDPQSRQCIEEMAELTQAINKFWRKQLKCGKQPMTEQKKESPECKHIVEEIADVQLMLWNMIYLLDADIQPIMREKLDRQLQRIKGSGKQVCHL